MKLYMQLRLGISAGIQIPHPSILMRWYHTPKSTHSKTLRKSWTVFPLFPEKNVQTTRLFFGTSATLLRAKLARRPNSRRHCAAPSSLPNSDAPKGTPCAGPRPLTNPNCPVQLLTNQIPWLPFISHLVFWVDFPRIIGEGKIDGIPGHLHMPSNGEQRLHGSTNKKRWYNYIHHYIPGSSKGCWMDDKGCLYTIL